jgi:glycosyltransferase involved in cell wall biosynthesis
MHNSDLRIALSLIGSPGWHGGITYVQNIIQALNSLSDKPQVFLYVDLYNIVKLEHHLHLTKEVDGLVILDPNQQLRNQLKSDIPIHFFDNHSDLFAYIDFLYPILNSSLPNYPTASWIPDFQHIHLPQFFSDKECKERNTKFDNVAKNAKLLLLSSEDVKKDFLHLYPNYSGVIKILHFHSVLPREYFPTQTQNILEKYNIHSKYLICCNQFWKHKNHITLFKAIAELKTRGLIIPVVCTGSTTDYRSKGFFSRTQA